jgi:nucleotide-binding universal stress UspA family protein
MLRSILLALDHSENSDAVVELGIHWTKQLGAKLVGIGIVDQPMLLSTAPAPESDEEAPELQGHWKEDEQRVEQCLERFSQRCDEAGVNAKAIKDVGPPSDRILLEANRHDLVLLSPHFQTPTSGGDLFRQVVRTSPRPVVSVPRELPAGDSIVIAFDGSVHSSRALQAFLTTGLDRSKNVFVVSIDDDSQEAARHCALAIEFLQLHDVKAEARPLESTGAVVEQLLAEVVALETGLLVLGVHQKPTLQEMFRGSVTKTILNESMVPLFLFQ